MQDLRNALNAWRFLGLIQWIHMNLRILQLHTWRARMPFLGNMRDEQVFGQRQGCASSLHKHQHDLILPSKIDAPPPCLRYPRSARFERSNCMLDLSFHM
mmetsp:Transcript_16288/g.35857  ORF Transcript_16288/g.35857 Transcript_16288/m.35857 type:complete len:100 (+) Transcript_16288:954-1253(+)